MPPRPSNYHRRPRREYWKRHRGRSADRPFIPREHEAGRSCSSKDALRRRRSSVAQASLADYEKNRLSCATRMHKRDSGSVGYFSSKTTLERVLQDAVSQDNAVELIDAWLCTMDLRSWVPAEERERTGGMRSISAASLATAVSSGELLFELLQVLQGVEVNHHPHPRLFAHKLWNANKALQEFRMQPRMPVRHLYSARAIARGEVETCIGLLDDVRTCQTYRRRWCSIRFYNTIVLERWLSRPTGGVSTL